MSENSGFEANRSTQRDAEALAFREAMSRVAGAVHLVTSDGPAGRAGLTASAVTSLSDHPATLLACLNATSRSVKSIRENGVFGVNTLAAQHQDLARRFSNGSLSMSERFDLGVWRSGAAGVPLLQGSLASFALKVSDIRQVATHLVVIGTVITAEAGVDDEPLVYHRRGYRILRDTEHR
ncbi:COG1853 Conserved protein/domain typically associated with flavoprotein oxygenases, DIM6/NTAB family [Rhabdaerophilaceae bacterium]